MKKKNICIKIKIICNDIKRSFPDDQNRSIDLSSSYSWPDTLEHIRSCRTHTSFRTTLFSGTITFSWTHKMNGDLMEMETFTVHFIFFGTGWFRHSIFSDKLYKITWITSKYRNTCMACLHYAGKRRIFTKILVMFICLELSAVASSFFYVSF